MIGVVILIAVVVDRLRVNTAEGPRRMAFEVPSERDLAAIGERLGMKLAPRDLATFRRYAADLASAYDRVAALDEALPPVRYPRSGWRRPTADENSLNAWYAMTSIKGAATGPLAGRRVALKDTIALAGVPMTDGSDVLEGLVPSFDATIVTRILDAGGEIAGKAVCEYLSYSSGSHTAVTGMVENPVKRGYSAAARRRAAPPWSRRLVSTWRSAATRPARSAFLRPIAASMG